MDISLWLGFLVAAVLISVSPGAGAVNTISSGLRYGVSGSLAAIMGLQLGYGAQVMIVGVGLGAVLASSVVAFEVIKWLGVAYLVWLGYQKWTQAPLSLDDEQSQKESNQRQFWQAAFVNLTNPKATVFLLALFPQFIDPYSATPVTQYVVMGSTLIMVDILVMLGYASLAAQLARWMKSERHQKMQNKVFGGMFICAAGLMASYRQGA